MCLFDNVYQFLFFRNYKDTIKTPPNEFYSKISKRRDPERPQLMRIFLTNLFVQKGTDLIICQELFKGLLRTKNRYCLKQC